MKILNIKLLYILLLTICYLPTFGQPPGDDKLNPTKFPTDGENPSIKCVKADVNMVYQSESDIWSSNVLDLYCPDKSTIQINATFDWTAWCLNTDCSHEFQLYICGIWIRNIKIDRLTNKLNVSFNVGKDLFDNLIESGLPRTGNCKIEIRLIQSCISMISGSMSTATLATFSSDIQVIDSNNPATNTYLTDVLVGKESFFGTGDEFVIKSIKTCCCNADEDCSAGAITLRLEDIVEIYEQQQTSTSTKHTIKWASSIKGTANTPKGVFLNGSFDLTGGYDGSMNWESSKVKGFKWTGKFTTISNWLVKAKKGKCAHPKFYIILDLWKTLLVEANCITEDKVIQTVREWKEPELINGNINIYPDSPSAEVAGCSGGKKSQSTKLEITASLYSNNCTGSLILGPIYNTDLDLATTQVWWTNESGEVFKGLNLNDVPFGTYTLHLEDQCCITYTETRTLCPRESVGPWRKSGINFCRNHTCAGDCTYEECVTPNLEEDVFDPTLKLCVKKYYFNTELLGTTSIDATSETKWNEFWERCETKWYCNGGEVFSEEYQPENTEWMYDDWDEECQLSVDCRGVQIENVSQVVPTVVWTWDDFWDECVSSYLACDGNEIDDEISMGAYHIGAWSFGSGSVGCVRQIVCVQGGQSIQQEIEPVFQKTDEQGNCDPGQLEWKVICDGKEVDFVCINAIKEYNTDNRLIQKPQNISIVNTGNNLQIKIKNESGANLSVKVLDMIGRISQSKNLLQSNEDYNVTIDGIPSGIYIISILKDGNILHSQKVFIQN